VLQIPAIEEALKVLGTYLYEDHVEQQFDDYID
jgi:DNA-binding FrmR family transcriptional regulator